MAPWGQSQSTQTQLPGVGALPGAYLGSAVGSQLANSLGWFGNNAATPFGLGMGGQSYISSPLAGTGLQNTWNTYMPSF